MAGHTALIHKQRQAFLFLLIQSCFIAAQEFVKIGIRRNQRSFIGLNRDSHIVKGYRIILTGKGLAKLLNISWHAGQGLYNTLRRAAHLYVRLNWPFRLFRKIRRPAVPELGGVKNSVEHGRRVSWPFLPAVTNRNWKVVVPTHAYVMTGIAGNQVARRQARLKK